MGMRASFHLGQDPDTHDDRDLEIEAGKIDKVVTLSVFSGYHGPDGAGKNIIFPMTKAQARAVASALMGCAAEIDG